MKYVSYIFGLLLIAQCAFSQSYVPEKNNKLFKVQPKVTINAYAFNLHDVKLLDSPFRNAMQWTVLM